MEICFKCSMNVFFHIFSSDQCELVGTHLWVNWTGGSTSLSNQSLPVIGQSELDRGQHFLV
jgi:hypothetical protein